MRQLKDLGLIIAYELHGFRYYSANTEEFLSDNIEAPTGKLLKELDEFDFGQTNFEFTDEFKLRVRRLFYSLISRSSSLHKGINNRSDL